MNVFFSHYVGPACTNRIEVRTSERPIVEMESQTADGELTPQQAAKLGRALIKAAKFVEKRATCPTPR